jgi:hypothetical protein
MGTSIRIICWSFWSHLNGKIKTKQCKQG